MAIKSRCTSCKITLNVPEDLRGEWVRCPGCGTKVEVLPEVEQRALEERERVEGEMKLLRDHDRHRLALIERYGEDGGATGDVESASTAAAIEIDKAETAPLPTVPPDAGARRGDAKGKRLRVVAWVLRVGSYLSAALFVAAAGLPVAIDGGSGAALGIGLASLGAAVAAFLALRGLAAAIEALGGGPLDARGG